MNISRGLTRPAGLLLLPVLLMLSQGAQAQFVAPAPTKSEGLNVPRPITTDPALLYPEAHEITLLPGDDVKISIPSATYGDTAVVAIDGTIQMPLLGTLKVAGLTIHEAEAAFATRMEERGMFVHPEVSMQVTPSTAHNVTILGEKSGSIPILTNKRLFDVLGLLGGLPATASHILTITRPGVDQPIVVDLGIDPAKSIGTNIPIFAGDTITIGSVGQFYVIGGVRTPGQHKLDGSLPTTVMEAISLSGGSNLSSKLNQTKLIRTIGSQRTVVIVPVKKILQGKEPDPILQADDILYVPINRFAQFIVEGGLTTAFGLFYTVEAATRY